MFLEPLLFGFVTLLCSMIISLILNLCLCEAPTDLSICAFIVLLIVVSYGPVMIIVNRLCVHFSDLRLQTSSWGSCHSVPVPHVIAIILILLTLLNIYCVGYEFRQGINSPCVFNNSVIIYNGIFSRNIS
jgi:hypothetical protein